MSIFEILQTKEVDIYISTVMMIAGVVLGVMVDIIRKQSEADIPGRTTVNQSVTITNIVNTSQYNRHTSTYQDDQMVAIMIGIALSICGIFYLFFRAEILNTIYTITLLVLSIWAGGIIHSLIKGQLSGAKWIGQLLYIAAFCFTSALVINKASIPSYAPEYFLNSQEIVNSYGLKGLVQVFSVQDFKWLAFHLLGIIGIFWAKSRVTLSTIHFASMGIHLSSSQSQLPWLARKTIKYSRFWENLLVVTIVTSVSYFLVSGDLFMWFEYALPQQLNSLVDVLINGRR